MKRKLTIKQLIILLLSFSVVMYCIHYLIFRDFHHIAIFFVHDIAFLPLEVILVSFGFDRLIEKTHEDESKSKLSIIETLFFNESGGNMLRYLYSCDANAEQLQQVMQVREDWKTTDFLAAQRQLSSFQFHVDVNKVDFFSLHYHLASRHDYYRNILENPAMTQSNEFTELVMKIYLLWEELDCSTSLYALPAEEKAYLSGMLDEIYQELSLYWLDNAYNHSIHNKARLHRMVASNPFHVNMAKSS